MSLVPFQLGHERVVRRVGVVSPGVEGHKVRQTIVERVLEVGLTIAVLAGHSESVRVRSKVPAIPQQEIHVIRNESSPLRCGASVIGQIGLGGAGSNRLAFEHRRGDLMSFPSFSAPDPIGDFCAACLQCSNSQVTSRYLGAT